MKFLSYLLFLFCLFPYLDFIKMGTDTQPNALVVAALLLFGIRNKKINRSLVLLWAVFGLSIFLVFYNNASLFLYFKNTLNYLSPPLVATATYVVFTKTKFRISFKAFVGTLSIYALVGLVQLYLIPDFMSFLLNEGRGLLIGGRGVVSLTTEPAYYGSTCLFFLCYSLLAYNKRQNIIATLFLLLQTIFISRSATAIAIFFAAIGLFTLIQVLRLKLRYIFSVLLFLVIATPVLLSFWAKLEETRAGQLAQTFIENPLLITQLDGSVSIRFTGSVAPFLSLRHHYMKPQGLGYYTEFLRQFRKKRLYTSFITHYNSEKKDRLSGSLNLVLFQLGFLGFLFPYAIYLAFKGRLREDAILFAFILFLVIMMTQIQLMHSMIGLIIGTALYTSKQKHISSESAYARLPIHV